MQILSPLPGVFYQKSSPDEPEFKAVGDDVKIGDTIGLIEVMKSFIEVKAERAGVFQSYITQNEAAVSPGDVLAELKAL